jgi:tetratricopeptide (TPR) repeat protein
MIWGYEDWDFWIGCLEKGFRVRRVPEPLFLYRMKPGSMYSNALKHDAELKARIILNHSALFDEAVRQKAETVLQTLVASGLSSGERPPQAIPADAQPAAVPSPPEVSDSKWPPEVTAHVGRAEDHFLKGDLPAARDSLREALVIVPRDPQLLIAYGNIVLQLGDVEGARREFVKAATLHPNHSPAHLNLAAVLVMLGRTQEAEASVRRALALNATDADALKLLGRLCMESGHMPVRCVSARTMSRRCWRWASVLRRPGSRVPPTPSMNGCCRLMAVIRRQRKVWLL